MIGAGGDQSAAVTADGRLYVWGGCPGRGLHHVPCHVPVYVDNAVPDHEALAVADLPVGLPPPLPHGWDCDSGSEWGSRLEILDRSLSFTSSLS